MNQQQTDNGLMTVLMQRYRTQRLPRALALQEKVERGESLSNYDVMFLQEVSAGVNEIKPLLHRHPECQTIAAQMMNLCKDIAEKGLANEPIA